MVSSPPTKAEQEAIAQALNDTDALIESLEQLTAKKRHLKQGATQELLRPKDGWMETSLGALGATFGGLTGKSKSDFGDGAAQYITFLNVLTNVVINRNAFEHVNVTGHNLCSRSGQFFSH